jgi:hypothetical protein
MTNQIETLEPMRPVKPNSELMARAKHVMDQNDAIIRMNYRLLDMLTSSVCLVRRARRQRNVTNRN